MPQAMNSVVFERQMSVVLLNLLALEAGDNGVV